MTFNQADNVVEKIHEYVRKQDTFPVGRANPRNYVIAIDSTGEIWDGEDTDAQAVEGPYAMENFNDLHSVILQAIKDLGELPREGENPLTVQILLNNNPDFPHSPPEYDGHLSVLVIQPCKSGRPFAGLSVKCGAS